MHKLNSKSFLGSFWVKGIFIISIVFSACNSDQFYQGKLIGMAMMVNKKCPQLLGNGVRMDSVSVLPKKTMQYHYTMLELSKDQLDTTIFKKVVDSTLVIEVKRNPDLKEFRDHEVTLIYTYYDKNHESIANIPIVPNRYK